MEKNIVFFSTIGKDGGWWSYYSNMLQLKTRICWSILTSEYNFDD